MLDGIYQSLICFFMAYALFMNGVFVTSSGQDLAGQERIGSFIGPAAVIVVNFYILMNMYRWDWLICLLVAISILLIFFWTGVYSSFTSSEFFYKAAAQVFAQPTFWAITALSVVICLLPRFFAKAVQKVYFPYDVDIIREQVKQGKFKYLDDMDSSSISKSNSSSTASSDLAQPSKQFQDPNDDRRPIYPPSVAPTATTHNPRSANGSDGTDYTRHKDRDSLAYDPIGNRMSIERPRPSMDRPRPSFDRMRASMDRMRPSHEASDSITSAAMLQRLESNNNTIGMAITSSPSRRHDITEEMQ